MKIVFGRDGTPQLSLAHRRFTVDVMLPDRATPTPTGVGCRMPDLMANPFSTRTLEQGGSGELNLSLTIHFKDSCCDFLKNLLCACCALSYYFSNDLLLLKKHILR